MHINFVEDKITHFRLRQFKLFKVNGQKFELWEHVSVTSKAILVY